MQLPSPIGSVHTKSVDTQTVDSPVNSPAIDGQAGDGQGETAAATEGVAAARSPASGKRTAPARSVATRFDVIVVGVAALVASTLGRAVAPALPGSTAGIGGLISGIEQLAGFSSQFMAVMGVST